MISTIMFTVQFLQQAEQLFPSYLTRHIIIKTMLSRSVDYINKLYGSVYLLVTFFIMNARDGHYNTLCPRGHGSIPGPSPANLTIFFLKYYKLLLISKEKCCNFSIITVTTKTHKSSSLYGEHNNTTDKRIIIIINC